jgi:glycosyltransferase involved in cell wall biosynthesis
MRHPSGILHVMTRLPVGGVENQLLNVLRHYDRDGLSPVVCSLSDKGEIGREMEEEGTEVVCLNRLGHRFDWNIVRELRELITNRGIIIVRTHQYHANLYGRLAARLAGTPCVVASVHNVYTRDRKPHRRLMNRLLAGWSDRIVAVSGSVREDVIKYDGVPGGKVTVIHNGVDIESFRNARGEGVREELGCGPETTVVGTVGRLTEQKGQGYLLEAAASLMKRYPFRLLVVGDGPLLDELRRMASSLGIAGEVTFTGMRRDIPALLAAMDVFVLPSLWEGMPNALLEAMAARRPVIATDIPPFREVISSPKHGVLVPPGDTGALAGALAGLLADKPQRMKIGSRAGEKAAASYNIKSSVNTYTDLFDSILKSKGINHI